jgi:hypothetical protein
VYTNLYLENNNNNNNNNNSNNNTPDDYTSIEEVLLGVLVKK